MTDAGATDEQAARLRNKVVDDLVADGTIASPAVEAAMRRVPRELFAPGAELSAVYHPWNGLVTKRDVGGRSLSSLSAPQAQAHMLEQARIEPGMNVLEVGSGGMNAAYLAELVGPSGRVVTVDIDEFVTGRAARFLAQAGYPDVHVVLADAEAGVAEFAPFDRVLVTVGAWDIPPAWRDQLVEGGRLVVPLQVMGLMRTVAFEKASDLLVSDSAKQFGFVPMQGAGAHHSFELPLAGGAVTLIFDEGAPADPAALACVLDSEPLVVDSGAGLRMGEPWATMQMWLATALPGFCRLSVDGERNEAATRPLPSRAIGFAVVQAGSAAYVVTRRLDGGDFTLDVYAHGPNAAGLAVTVAEQVRIWDRDHRGGPGPRYLVVSAATPDAELPAGDRVIDKIHSRIVLSWPRPADSLTGQDTAHQPLPL
ncbi:methyltransferase, FxLD system [Pseudofrankia inefficax]|uniref:Protein-L-isoaspartate O-methyltransferase n=1 Tax=Pseudofrankia inefficax (strain DSM 45817 / CECT 9037 / DDB 130130 / EuI1c) TaxID=298654 RepID=E3IVY8_PSEI1|nr:methyltransferase, FxLD system [Pseudofrankia inefficax]ADP84916.1 protein-L-isoaspartate(D-aspartate) O-methyltransferase [Pseudofrankia inefficax]